jgi:phosphatidate phosphatase LPIN
MSPKSDSELELRALEPSPLRTESHMQWAWGRLPKVSSSIPPSVLAFHPGLHELGLE